MSDQTTTQATRRHIDRLRDFDAEMKRRGYSWTFRLPAIAAASASVLAVYPVDHGQFIDLLDEIRRDGDA